jgi:hypothetical protein
MATNSATGGLALIDCEECGRSKPPYDPGGRICRECFELLRNREMRTTLILPEALPFEKWPEAPGTPGRRKKSRDSIEIHRNQSSRGRTP